VVGPFGAGSVFGAKSPPLSIVRGSLAARRTRLGQMVDALLRRATQSRQPSQWEGMKMMLDQQIRADDPALERVYDHFAVNLRDILSTAIGAGAKPIVCSVSSNLKDCPPFASLHAPGLSGPRKAQWEALVSSGAELESQKNYAKALAQYRQAADIDNSYAGLAFRTARCYLALGETAAAHDQYIRARDFDALRFRADTRITHIIHDVCVNLVDQGVAFLDSESVVTNTCPQGIPDDECFWDHVHFNFRGNYKVARKLADEVISLLPGPILQLGSPIGLGRNVKPSA
jgi:tetratricopeptide (TPR) repeat protein